VVRLLLEIEVDAKAKESSGWTALHLAASGGHEAVVRLLLGKGVDVEAKAKDSNTALHLAAYYGHSPVVQLLLDKGADFKSPGDGRHSPEQLAIKQGKMADMEETKERYKAVVRLLKAADFAALELAEERLSSAQLADSNFKAGVVHFLKNPQRKVLQQVPVSELLDGQGIIDSRIDGSSLRCKWIHLPANNV
jgi:ankyrin repeat protein